MMERYFIAIVPKALDVHPELKKVLSKLKRTVGDWDVSSRWTASDQYHLTLEFLGPLSDSDREIVIDRLKTFRFHDFALELSGLGVFPEADAARVLWIGAKKTKALEDLQSQLREHLHGIEYPADERNFVPHVTLARFRNPVGARELVGLGARKAFGRFFVDEIVLFASVIQGQMSKYIPVYRKVISDSDQAHTE